MTDLTPVASYDNVRQLETTDLGLAGVGGPMNEQAQSLLNRTTFLKVQTDAAADTLTKLQDKVLSINGSNIVGARRSIFNASVSAAQRTQGNILNDLPIFVTEWAGIDKTGATDISVALQAFIDAVAAISSSGAIIVFPEGTYKFQNIDLPGTGDWIFRGNGDRRSKLLLANDNNALFLWDDNYAFTHKQFENLGFYGGTTINGRGLQATRVRELKFINCHVEHLAYNMLIDRARGIIIDDVTCRTSGTWFFHSTDDDDYIHNIMISNVIDPVGTDIKTLYNLDEAFRFKDVVNANMVNVSYSGLAGTTRFLHIIGKTEGVFGYNIICAWPSVGILYSSFTYAGTTIIGTIRPQYTGFTNVGLDQPAVSCLVVTGDYHFFTGCWFANGTTRLNTGAGVSVEQNARGIRIVDTYIAFHRNDGAIVEVGAQDIQFRGCIFRDNNSSLGANFDLRDQTTVQNAVLLRDCSPAMTTSTSVNRFVAGTTSNIIHSDVATSSATTAVTTAEDLKTYTIPAGRLQAGQLVKLRAWGTTAANANNKTIRVFFGASSLGGLSAAANNLDWMISADVWIKTTTSQNAIRSSVIANQSGSDYQSLTANLALATVVKVQGQNGTASAGDIVCEGFTVEFVS